MTEKTPKALEAFAENIKQNPPLEGRITPEQFISLWRYARIRSLQELKSLLILYEMLETSRDPVSSFSAAMLLWFDNAREVMREDPEEDQEVLH